MTMEKNEIKSYVYNLMRVFEQTVNRWIHGFNKTMNISWLDTSMK